MNSNPKYKSEKDEKKEKSFNWDDFDIDEFLSDTNGVAEILRKTDKDNKEDV